jgi:hypothetical protein
MPRLIDDIRRLGMLQMPRMISKIPEWEEYGRDLWPILSNRDMPVLLIDNVADYYYTGTDQEHWDLGRDFPNLAPPYECFWCEYRLPKRIHSKEKGDTDVSQWVQHGRAGCFVMALEPDHVKADGGLPQGTRWILWVDLFVDYGWTGRLPEGPHAPIFLCVDAEGRALDAPHAQAFIDEEHVDLMKSVMAWLHPIWLTMSFLHCKNVAVVDNAVDKPLAKKWHAKTGVWPTPYKTLVIEPLKAILRHQGGAEKSGLARAMHICRGHFKDYREGRGLFGKYHQLVWQPSILRGTKGKAAPPREIEVKI